MNDPSSLRYATAAIITVISLLVGLGAVVIRIFDPDDYPTIGGALWFTLQTVTTVGYGDNTPTSAFGRVVASIVMLVSIGLITVVTAVITSLFIRAAGREELATEPHTTTDALQRIEASLNRAHDRLDRIEHRLTPHLGDADQQPDQEL